MEKYYKFKNVKHSVVLVFIEELEDGRWLLENKEYKGLTYKAKPEDLEEVLWIKNYRH